MLYDSDRYICSVREALGLGQLVYCLVASSLFISFRGCSFSHVENAVGVVSSVKTCGLNEGVIAPKNKNVRRHRG